MDGKESYLIDHFVLRVARQAAEAMEEAVTRQVGQGHVVIVGNPLPIPAPFRKLPFAEKEAEIVEDILNKAGVPVEQEHFFKANRNPKATKTRVKQALQGAAWWHVF